MTDMDSIKHLADAITALRRAYDAATHETTCLVATAENAVWRALRAIVDEHIPPEDEVSQ